MIRVNYCLICITFIAGSYTAKLYAADEAFQNFLFTVCQSAAVGSELAARCQESVDGDLSGDSEDSLTPTQSLSHVSNALAETKARIKALQPQLKQQRDKNKKAMEQSEDQQSTMQRFQMAGFSLLLNAENSDLTHELTDSERGYNADSWRLQLGADYRLRDNWIVGSTLSLEHGSNRFDPDQPGTNFIPGDNEGDSDSDALSLNVFTTYNFSQSFYLDGLVSYSWTDYGFSRIGLFQESTRTLPTQDVITRADSSGTQMILGLGAGWDKSVGAHNIQLYARLNYQHSEIDAYEESGGAGFAMQVEAKKVSETQANAGIRYAYNLLTDFGVLVPQLFAEQEYLSNARAQTTTSRFVLDTNNTPFTVQGDAPDSRYGRAGAGLVLVLPDGWIVFVNYTEMFGKTFFSQRQVNAGLRIEF